jgi:hypothetical protein
MPQPVSPLSSIAYEAITVADTAIGLTVGNVRGYGSNRYRAEKVILTVETAQLRWRDDGNNPTSSEGHLANVGSVLTLDNRDRIEKFRAIRTGATSATLRCTYLA